MLNFSGISEVAGTLGDVLVGLKKTSSNKNDSYGWKSHFLSQQLFHRSFFPYLGIFAVCHQSPL